MVPIQKPESAWRGKAKHMKKKKEVKTPGIKPKRNKEKYNKNKGKSPKKPSKKKAKKLKQEASGDALEGGDGQIAASPAPQAVRGPPSAAALDKVRKLKIKKKQLTAAQMTQAKTLAAKIAQRSPEEQANWLWSSYQHATSASKLEREASGLTSSCMVPLPTSTKRSLEQSIKTIEPNWESELASSSGRAPGELSALIISPAALGCTAVIKACADLNSGCRIEKLFSKHLKLKEQVEALGSKVTCVGAGTPNRVSKLIGEGAVKLNKLKWVFLDVSLNSAKRTILDQPETCGDWWSLWEAHLKAVVAGGQAKVVLFGGKI